PCNTIALIVKLGEQLPSIKFGAMHFDPLLIAPLIYLFCGTLVGKGDRMSITGKHGCPTTFDQRGSQASGVVGITNFHQIKAFRRRGRAAGPAVAGGKGAGNVIRTPPSEPDQLQGPGYVPHLVVQKRAGSRPNMDLVAIAAELERVERL